MTSRRFVTSLLTVTVILPHELGILFEVAALRLQARELGITELIAQGKNIRVVGNGSSRLSYAALKRIYKTVQYRPVTHTLIIPTPFQGILEAACYEHC